MSVECNRAEAEASVNSLINGPCGCTCPLVLGCMSPHVHRRWSETQLVSRNQSARRWLLIKRHEPAPARRRWGRLSRGLQWDEKFLFFCFYLFCRVWRGLLWRRSGRVPFKAVPERRHLRRRPWHVRVLLCRRYGSVQHLFLSRKDGAIAGQSETFLSQAKLLYYIYSSVLWHSGHIQSVLQGYVNIIIRHQQSLIVFYLLCCYFINSPTLFSVYLLIADVFYKLKVQALYCRTDLLKESNNSKH